MQNNNNSFGGKKGDHKEEQSYYQKEEETGSEWWNESMDRRSSMKTLAYVGGGVLVGSIVIASIFGDDDDSDDVETQQDSKSLQQKEGWNVGATDKQLFYPQDCLVDSDSRTAIDWQKYLGASTLNAIYEPKKANLKPYNTPTLVQSLSMPALATNIKLSFTPEMARAYSQGLGVKEILSTNKNNDNLLLIVDMPGAESVAFSAAMADCADIVLTFDNIPHPLGVVPAHLTLASLVYYAGEIEEKKQKRVDNAVSLFVMDRSRFVEKISEDTQFDNRYLAKIPTIDDLKKSGVNNIMYCVNNEKQELDDLNDDFVEYQKQGIAVNLIDLGDFKRSENDSTAALPFAKSIGKDTLNTIRNQYQSAPPVYHYGGGVHFIPIFYGYNPYMAYGGRTVRTTVINNNMRAPSYRPVSRPTMFSAKNFGGASGVGRSRPSGFGMVSTRVSSSTGKLSGVRAGRSGSFGRSGGRGG